jgi:hypothetical protein
MAVALAAIKVAEAAEAERPKYTRRSNGSWIHTKGKPWYGKFQAPAGAEAPLGGSARHGIVLRHTKSKRKEAIWVAT